jgi:hypothetical protein
MCVTKDGVPESATTKLSLNGATHLRNDVAREMCDVVSNRDIEWDGQLHYAI